MRRPTKPALLRIPHKLSFTALGVAALGTIACSSQSSSAADAAVDALEDMQVRDALVADAPADTTLPSDATPACVAPPMQCAPKVAGAVCPPGPICHLSDCPDAGCQTELV
jgi:hypothetical protein